MAQTRLISIIIPTFNEVDNIAPLYAAIKKAITGLDYRFQILFVDDGSRDGTQVKLRQLAKQDKSVNVIEFVRNFGKEIALTAGLQHTAADAALLIDADLQHPPELIPEFIKRWQAGSDVVVGVRDGGRYPLFRKVASNLFYAIINRISATPIVPHATDYRLLDRVAIDEFNRFTERNRLSRGLIDWLGFQPDYIYFNVGQRRHGQSLGRLKLLQLALNSFVSHSLVPLKIAGYLGVVTTFLSGALGLFIIIERYILNDPLNLHFSGPAILAVIIVFMVGIVLISLGLIALYIANIHSEVMNRPLYIIRRPRGQIQEVKDRV